MKSRRTRRLRIIFPTGTIFYRILSGRTENILFIYIKVITSILLLYMHTHFRII